jgi:hypothetical protein
MTSRFRTLTTLLALALLCLSNPASGETAKTLSSKSQPRDASGVLWREPTDIASRDLFYGAGGKEHEPKGPFRFVKEDMGGTNPKFIIEDARGSRWKVKLGPEVNSETAATRLLWAVGYFTDEDYFLPQLVVQEMKKLNRGQRFVSNEGTIRGARLERQEATVKKIGNWNWFDNPFVGRRELTGLKVMMSLINNWDLKKSNNDIYQVGQERRYLISDLGATFGNCSNGGRSKANLKAYTHSKFLRKVTPEEVDIRMPSRPPWWAVFALTDYIKRTRASGLGNDLPRADVQWIAQLLARLSDQQLADTFRGAGFTAPEVDGFSRKMRERITELNRLNSPLEGGQRRAASTRKMSATVR